MNAVDLTRRKIREQLPDNEVTRKIDDFLEDPSTGVKRERPFPTVEFSHNDEVLDKNCYRWVYSKPDCEWYCTSVPMMYHSVAELAYVKGPLMFQNGTYRGITMLKDGSLRWG